MITFSRVDPSFSLVEAAPASPTDAMAMTASQYNVYQLHPKAQDQRFHFKKTARLLPATFRSEFSSFWGWIFPVFARLSSLTVKTREGGRAESRENQVARLPVAGGVNQKFEPSTLEALVGGLRRRVGKDKDSILGIISWFFSPTTNSNSLDSGGWCRRMPRVSVV